MQTDTQAFSHFTSSNLATNWLLLMFRGVGDLYTDPQIHTVTWRRLRRRESGDQRHGPILPSHRCNLICESPGDTSSTSSEVEDLTSAKPESIFERDPCAVGGGGVVTPRPRTTRWTQEVLPALWLPRLVDYDREALILRSSSMMSNRSRYNSECDGTSGTSSCGAKVPSAMGNSSSQVQFEISDEDQEYDATNETRARAHPPPTSVSER